MENDIAVSFVHGYKDEEKVSIKAVLELSPNYLIKSKKKNMNSKIWFKNIEMDVVELSRRFIKALKNLKTKKPKLNLDFKNSRRNK